MACHKGVVFALAGVGEAAQSAHSAVFVEKVAAACEYLVRIRLMAYVPHQSVVRRVKHIVKRHIYLHCTHA